MTLLEADIPAAMTARARCRMDVGVIMLAVAAALATQIAPGSPVRALTILAAFLLVPGWSLVSLLRSGPAAAMLGLAIGLSLGIDVLISLALVWTGLFTQAITIAAVVGTAAVLLLIRDALGQARAARTGVPELRAAG